MNRLRPVPVSKPYSARSSVADGRVVFEGAMSQGKATLNYLDFTPTQAVAFEIASDGHVLLLVPRFRSKPLHLIAKFRPHMRVHLDEVGSYVWTQIDGEKTLGEIAKLTEEKFGARVLPVYERVSFYFRELVRSHFVILTPPSTAD